MAVNLNKARLDVLNKAIHKHYQHSWQWRLAIAGAPDDLDFYVKDISYGPIEIETNQKSVGAGVITLPTRAQPVTVSMTVRDDQDERVFQWMADWAALVVNGSGHSQKNYRSTLNVPQNYLRTVTRYQLLMGPGYTLTERKSPGREWEVFPTQVGDITESRDDQGMLEFPITLMQMLSV